MVTLSFSKVYMPFQCEQSCFAVLGFLFLFLCFCHKGMTFFAWHVSDVIPSVASFTAFAGSFLLSAFWCSIAFSIPCLVL